MGTAKIKLDKDLIESAEEYSVKAGYGSVEEFITHLIERELQGGSESDSEEKIKERLRGLGYIS